MKRLILPVLFVVAFAGCNFEDEVSFPGATNNTTAPNNGMTNGTANNGGADMGNNGTGGIEVDITNVLVNGNALPTEILAGSGPFAVAANVTVANSPDCAGCNIQIVVGVPDGGPPGCLIDAPAGADIAGSTTIEAPASPGARQLLYLAYEEADCDAAIALAESDTGSESLGQITFTAPDDLSVTSISPAPDELNVIVDGMIRIAFNGPIDPGSVTGRVRVDAGGTAVVSTVAVDNDEIVVTPQSPFREFQTVYTVSVTAGITSGTRTLETDYTSTFTTRMFVPNVFYRAETGFHGPGYSLAIDTANLCTMRPTDDTAPAQRFRFVPRDNGNGWVAYNSNPVAASRGLDGADGATPCIMVPIPAEGPEAGQVWRFKRQANGTFWMQNMRFNENQSLDATVTDLTVSGNTAAPLMQPTLVNEAQEIRQDWIWVRVP